MVVRAFGHVSTPWFRVHVTSTSPTAVVMVHVYLSIIVHVYLAPAAAAGSIFAQHMSQPNRIVAWGIVSFFTCHNPRLPLKYTAVVN